MSTARCDSCAVCKAPAPTKCAGCHKVAYCSIKHQKEDRKEHRGHCLAYTVVYQRQLGAYYLVAARDLEEGDVIVSETPLVLGPSHLLDIDKMCIGCLRGIGQDHVNCPRCDWPACSVTCPGLTDPIRHGAECVILSLVKSSISSHCLEAIFPLRCFLLQNRNPRKCKRLFKKAKEADEALIVQWLQGGCHVFLEEAILKPLSKVAPRIIPDFLPETLRKISSLCCSYVLTLKLRHTGCLSAVTEVASLMQHCCMPNTRVYFEYPDQNDPKASNGDWRGRVVVRAAQNIKAGETLTTVRASSIEATAVRRKGMVRSCNMVCTCARCSDPTELGTHFGTLKCSKCPGWVLPINPLELSSCWRCTDCDLTHTAEFINDFHLKLTNDLDSLKFLRRWVDSDPEYVEDLLVICQELLLHPTHSVCVALKVLLVQQFGLGLMETRVPVHAALSVLTDVQLERITEVSREIVDILFKFYTVCPSDFESAHKVFLLTVSTNLELLKRRACRSEILDRKERKRLLNENRNLLIRSYHIYCDQFIGLKVPPKQDLPEAVAKSILAEANKAGYPVPVELL